MKIEELESFEHTLKRTKKYTKLAAKDKEVLKNNVKGGSTQCQTQKKTQK